MTNQSKVIGLIAGQGDLPLQIINQCLTQNQPIVAIAFDGQTPASTIESIPHIWLKLGTVGALLDYLKAQKVTHIVMAGGIKRPSISELSLDWTGTKLLAKLGVNSLGDDGVLKAIIAYLEQQGFNVIGADDILEDLFASKDNLTETSPTEEDLQNINLGYQALLKLGAADIGQALVIQQGLILGVEAIEGTENLIKRVHEYIRPGRGPILIKMPKPQQSLKADLPTIGLETVRQCVTNGFAGIAIQAGKTQFLNKTEAIEFANQEKIFIYGF